MLSGEAKTTNLWFDKEEYKVMKTSHCVLLVSELKNLFSRNSKTFGISKK
jgi:hypothetical protein